MEITVRDAKAALEIISGFLDGYLESDMEGFNEIESAESLLYKFIAQQGGK